jgi:hypothetical protein
MPGYADKRRRGAPGRVVDSSDDSASCQEVGAVYAALSGKAHFRSRPHHSHRATKPPHREKEMPRHKHITGLEAARLADDHAQREPVKLLPSESGKTQFVEARSTSADQLAKKAPPRLAKLSGQGDAGCTGAQPALAAHPGNATEIPGMAVTQSKIWQGSSNTET